MNKLIDYSKEWINEFLAKSITGYIIYITGSLKRGFFGAYMIYKVIGFILNFLAKTGLGTIWLIMLSCYVPVMIPTLSIYEAYYEVAIQLGKGNQAEKSIIRGFIDLAFVIIQNLFK